MSRQDMLTGKKAMTGNIRSHALNSTKRRFNLNLQKVTLNDGGKPVTLRVTAKTAKTLKKHGLV
ncbi:50S ribosomal protein L28 [Mycoplasmopsis californica]|uniref:Large ribosomal subunit protein bL28 n=1 Tax=Mycoplasmopsis equigenitalium TaxID=114883 RepID=A0ABY5J5Y0_9BACT|nr:50S ribosomal protein L28 [Mycoplasmopsis equigenitalium]UUD37281.1 50S ribosomal protein L28 [Mycoplasmopsis equigenitalium]VEU69410.1 50S ribosomal protein L28 [Mycoplasmopsis californica]